ncbi:MAG: GTPase Era, partial [Myxococcota bacterium]
MNDDAVTKSGTVALVGRSNVGKSTLLNAALALPLAIVSRKPQTTRDRLLGVVRHGGAEIGLLDTPGFHRARSRLGKEMNRHARRAAKEADVVCFVVSLPPRPVGELTPHPGDLALLAQVQEDATTPVVLVINKIDLLKRKDALLPLIAQYAERRTFAAVVPVSAQRDDGVTRILDEVAPLLPDGDPRFDEDTLTDRPLRYFAAEYVREPILRVTSQEVPHAVAVTVERFSERSGGLVDIHATIHVERNGQKRIIIGDKGAGLKRIGTEARQRVEDLLGQRVNLQLFVRVTPDWRERPAALADFGLTLEAAETAPLDLEGLTDDDDGE